MRVLITGGGGMLARSLAVELPRQGMEVVGLSRQSLDVLDADSVERQLDVHEPDAVIQCAAYTRVDDAEDERDLAFRVNADGAGIVASACQRRDILFVYPSTDYVFGGESSTPSSPEDAPAPVNTYGESKLAGEAAARSADRSLIVRTSWLYGHGGRNFVDTISDLAGKNREIKVVADQVGLPTWTGSLAYVFGRLLKAGAVGTFHAADAGEPVCWHDFARTVLEIQKIDTVILPVTSEEYGAKARRPRFSVLDCSKTERTIGENMPRRDASLAEFLSDRLPG